MDRARSGLMKVLRSFAPGGVPKLHGAGPLNRLISQQGPFNGKDLDMTRTTVVVFASALLLGSESPALAQGNPLRDAYFGELHVHTSWSLDAWLFGNRVTDPGDAYKYFKGETIKHPLGYDIKIETPLDFAGVTDHSEYVGVMKLANDPSSPISKLPAAAPLILKNNSPEEVQRVVHADRRGPASNRAPRTRGWRQLPAARQSPICASSVSPAFVHLSSAWKWLLNGESFSPSFVPAASTWLGFAMAGTQGLVRIFDAQTPSP
jgi:hypothetical protein